MSSNKGFKSILFIADNAPDEGYALRRAVEMASQWKSRLVVMDVLELSSLEGDVLRRFHPTVKLQDKLLRAREAALQAMITPYSTLGLDIRVKVGKGRLHTEVVRTITRGGHTLLIKGAKGPAQEPRAIGPMDSRLIRLSPSPVLILRERPRGPVLAAVALETLHGDEGIGDALLLRNASAFAELSEAALHLAHAWELPDEKVLQVVSSDGEQELLRVAIEEAHKVQLEKMLARHPHIAVTPHLREGWASHVVPRLIDELQVELLVIGGARKGREACPATGSILEVILYQVGCSILVVK